MLGLIFLYSASANTGAQNPSNGFDVLSRNFDLALASQNLGAIPLKVKQQPVLQKKKSLQSSTRLEIGGCVFICYLTDFQFVGFVFLFSKLTVMNVEFLMFLLFIHF